MPIHSLHTQKRTTLFDLLLQTVIDTVSDNLRSFNVAVTSHAVYSIHKHLHAQHYSHLTQGTASQPITHIGMINKQYRILGSYVHQDYLYGHPKGTAVLTFLRVRFLSCLDYCLPMLSVKRRRLNEKVNDRKNITFLSGFRT